MKLSKRLLACANYTQGFNKLADIGTDHAKLPIHCINEGFVSKALAIDNKEGPFVIAYANVKKAELFNKIEVIKSDGIKDIDNDVDVIVISGMGGKLISDIIMTNSLKNIKRLILQPNCDANTLRHSINLLVYKIIEPNSKYRINLSSIRRQGHDDISGTYENKGRHGRRIYPYRQGHD